MREAETGLSCKTQDMFSAVQVELTGVCPQRGTGVLHQTETFVNTRSALVAEIRDLRKIIESAVMPNRGPFTSSTPLQRHINTRFMHSSRTH